MVHTFIYENLLSISKNRDYYVKLFEISITRRKILDQKSFGNLNLLAICDELLKETKSKNSMNIVRKKFYVASQLTYGTLIFYRWQAENLLVTVKSALVSCNLKFGDSLTALSQESRTSKVSKKTVKRKNETTKNDLQLPELEVDEDDLFKKPDVKRRKVMESDSTMVTNIQSITMFETQTIQKAPVALPQDDFGELTTDELNLFFGDPTVPGKTKQNKSQDLFSQMDEDINSLMVEPSRNQLNTLRSTITVEINQETYIVSPKRAFQGDFESEVPRKKIHLSPRASKDEIGNATMEESTEIPEPTDIEDEKAREPTASNLEASEILVVPEANELENPEDPVENPEDLEIPKRKSRKCSNKLIIDAITKIPKKNMEKQLETWDTLVIQRPRETFFHRMVDIKMNLNNLVPFPLHRKMSDQLLFLYQRNLKKVPLNLSRSLKKTSDQKQERVARYSLRGKDAVKIEEIPEVAQIADVPENPPEIPQNPEIPELEQSEVPQIPQIPDSELPGIAQIPEVQGFTPTKFTTNSSFQKYDEKDKWTREQILDRLKKLWRNKRSGPINMQKFNIKNRFVFAGVLFELLTLNKMQVIELVQTEENLEIYDIKKGAKYES